MTTTDPNCAATQWRFAGATQIIFGPQGTTDAQNQATVACAKALNPSVKTFMHGALYWYPMAVRTNTLPAGLTHVVVTSGGNGYAHAITAATVSGTVATIQTTAAHGFSVGSITKLYGFDQGSAFYGQITIATVPDSTHFTFTVPSGTANPTTIGTYDVVPAVAVSGGTCSTTPILHAVLGHDGDSIGNVVDVIIDTAGSCSVLPNLVIDAPNPPSSSNTALATALSYTPIRGYDSTPTVTFSGGGCTTTPTGTPVLNTSPGNGGVDSVTIVNQGAGCTSAPTVTFSNDPDGGKAVGHANVVSNHVSSVSMDDKDARWIFEAFDIEKALANNYSWAFCRGGTHPYVGRYVKGRQEDTASDTDNGDDTNPPDDGSNEVQPIDNPNNGDTLWLPVDNNSLNARAAVVAFLQNIKRWNYTGIFIDRGGAAYTGAGLWASRSSCTTDPVVAGYSVAPTVTISGGTFTVQATAHAVLNQTGDGGVTVVMDNAGAYTVGSTPPTVTFANDPTGWHATAPAVIDASGHVSITVPQNTNGSRPTLADAYLAVSNAANVYGLEILSNYGFSALDNGQGPKARPVSYDQNCLDRKWTSCTRATDYFVNQYIISQGASRYGNRDNCSNPTASGCLDAVIVGYTSGTTLTVSSITAATGSPGKILLGDYWSYKANTPIKITAQTSGTTGGAGVYTLASSAGTIGSSGSPVSMVASTLHLVRAWDQDNKATDAYVNGQVSTDWASGFHFAGRSIAVIADIYPPTAAGFTGPLPMEGYASQLSNPVIHNAGTGYAVNDILVVKNGMYSSPAKLKVTSVSAGTGAITGIQIYDAGVYFYAHVPIGAVIGDSLVSSTSGSGASFDVTWLMPTTQVSDADRWQRAFFLVGRAKLYNQMISYESGTSGCPTVVDYTQCAQFGPIAGDTAKDWVVLNSAALGTPQTDDPYALPGSCDSPSTRHCLWVTRYQNGLVIVNPTDASKATGAVPLDYSRTVTGASLAGTTLTLTTADNPNGLTSGQQVQLQGFSNANLNATFTLTGVTSSTMSFTVVSGTVAPTAGEYGVYGLGTAMVSTDRPVLRSWSVGATMTMTTGDNANRVTKGTVTAVSISGTVATITTSGTDNLIDPADVLQLAGFTGGSALNGTFTVIASTPTTFKITVPSGTTVPGTLGTFASVITQSGFTDTDYNGSFVVTAVSADSYSYASPVKGVVVAHAAGTAFTVESVTSGSVAIGRTVADATGALSAKVVSGSGTAWVLDTDLGTVPSGTVFTVGQAPFAPNKYGTYTRAQAPRVNNGACVYVRDLYNYSNLSSDTCLTSLPTQTIEAQGARIYLYSPTAFNYFTQPFTFGFPSGVMARASIADVSPAGLRVFQLGQAIPMKSTQDYQGFGYYPATDLIQSNTDATIGNSEPDINFWSFVWEDRDNSISTSPPNYIYPSIVVGTKQGRTEFTSKTKADASSKAKLAYLLGKQAHVTATLVCGAGCVNSGTPATLAPVFGADGSVTSVTVTPGSGAYSGVLPTVTFSSDTSGGHVTGTVSIVSGQPVIAITVGNAYGEGYLDLANAGGIADADVLTQAYASANAATVFVNASTDGGSTYLVTRDRIVLPSQPILPRTGSQLVTSPYGVEIDWEVGDNHTVAGTLAVSNYEIGLIHAVGLKGSFFTDPLNSTSTAVKNGLSAANVNDMAHAWDVFTLFSYDANGGGSADYTSDPAVDLPRMVDMIWPVYASAPAVTWSGGTCSTQPVATSTLDAAGHVNGVNFSVAGVCTVAPSISFAKNTWPAPGTYGNAATATTALAGSAVAVTMTENAAIPWDHLQVVLNQGDNAGVPAYSLAHAQSVHTWLADPTHTVGGIGPSLQIQGTGAYGGGGDKSRLYNQVICAAAYINAGVCP